MKIFSSLFGWITKLFRFGKSKDVSSDSSDVESDSESEKKEEKFVEERIAEVAKDLVEAQHAEQIIKETEKIEESGQVTGKSLEEIEKEEQEMMLKLNEFENELSSFRKQLDEILTHEENQDEDMENKIDLAKGKGDEYLKQLTTNLSMMDNDEQLEVIIKQVIQISGRVESFIESHRSTVESVRRSLDQSIISTQESIEGIIKIKEKGHIIISLFDGVEFKMSALKDRMINSSKELEISRERRDKFLKGWFDLMDEELELEREGYASKKFSEQASKHHEKMMESYS